MDVVLLARMLKIKNNPTWSHSTGRHLAKPKRGRDSLSMLLKSTQADGLWSLECVFIVSQESFRHCSLVLTVRDSLQPLPNPLHSKRGPFFPELSSAALLD